MITRRAFLKSGGLAVVAFGVGGSPLFLNRTAQAARALAPLGRRKVLVALFQRGAMDGLMAVPPLGDPFLPRHRPRLAMTGPKRRGPALLELDGRFGLHPAFSPLAPYFQEGRLAIVHGTGSPASTRSHFDAQEYMETGTPGRKGTRSGWLNRAVGLLGHEPTPFQAVAIASALPRSFYGEAPALAIADLDDLQLRQRRSRMPNLTGQSLEALYEETSQQLLRSQGRESFEALRIMEHVRAAKAADDAPYPRSPLGNSLRQIAQLVKADVGLEIAFAESGGWDTHANQGTVRGSFARRAQDLAESIAAFWEDLGERADDVVLMTMTEFGRTVKENGSGGTDHGRGSCLFVLGHDVEGGRVYGDVPPLDLDALEDRRDLPVTTDFRAVFAGLAGPHLGIEQDYVLFPGWQGDRLTLLR